MTPTGSKAHCYVTFRGGILCVTQAIIVITWRDHSLIVCSRHIYLCVALCAHPICGESHFQCNSNWEVTTTSPPFCCELHLSHLAPRSHPGQSTTLLWLESPGGKYAKLHTVAASNNRDPTSCSSYFCLFATHIYIYGCCSSLSLHPVRGDSHIQHNIDRMVATLAAKLG